jgi:hypothetical protein
MSEQREGGRERGRGGGQQANDHIDEHRRLDLDPRCSEYASTPSSSAPIRQFLSIYASSTPLIGRERREKVQLYALLFVKDPHPGPVPLFQPLRFILSEAGKMGEEVERLVLVCFRRHILASAALACVQLDNVGP